MSFTIARSAVTVLVAATGTLFWTADAAQAQCQGGSQQQSSSSQQQFGGQRQQRTGFQRQQQTGQQNGLLQQIALQDAMLQQQRMDLILALQQQQDALMAARLRQQQMQRYAEAQQRTEWTPVRPQFVARTVDPEETAIRQVNIARTLSKDADDARRDGDRDRATTLRTRAEVRLQRVISKYSGTQTADTAQRALDKLWQ